MTTAKPITSIAILAGGLGTRLYPITKTIPKNLIEFNGIPFVDYQLKLLKHNKISDVVFCIGNLSDQIENHVGNGSKYGLSVKYSYDGDTLVGTGGAIKKALPFLDDIFFVLYGDSYLPIDYQKPSSLMRSKNKLGLMTVFKNNNRWDTSNIIYKNHTVIEYNKHHPDERMEYIDYGLSLIRKSAFDLVPTNKKIDLSSIFETFVKDQQMLGFPVRQRFYEIGSFQGIENARQYFNSKKYGRYFYGK